MAQGNPNKVNAIVDEIVENNNVFKLKSPIEQDKEKDSIAKSINSALSVLNEVGKELVLQELSVDPDEKFKGFIDSVGNVDISGLSQMTATIVKEKIIEAEKEGIDLRQGQPVFKDNTKALLVGGVLTVAVIDTMIRDYDNLSDKEIQTIIENYSDLPPEMQNAFNNKQADRLDQIADNIDDEKTKQAVKEQSKMTRVLVDKNQKEAEEFSKSSNKTQIIINTYREVSKSILELGKIYKNNAVLRLNQEIGELFSLDEETSLEEILSKKSEQELIEIFEKLQSIRDEFVHQANEAQKEKSKTKENETSEEKETRHEEMRNISLMVISVTKDLDKKNFPDLDKSETENSKNVEDKVKEEDKNPESPYNDSSKVQQPKSVNLIKTEIEQLPIALAKSNFSQEDIMKAMKQYRDYISNYSEISENISDSIKASTSDEIVLNIQDDFNSLKEEGQINSNVHQILNILAQVNYGSSMQQILTNSEVREQFLAQFDKVIEQGINLEQDVKLDGELAQIFSQYFKDNAEEMDISAIEEQKEQVTDEQVKQEEPKEMFSFIDSEYLKQDSIEGLIPRNGENSQSLQDDKKAIFYSQGKEGAIVMYFEFLKQYERLKGSAGDKALEQYANYKNGTIELSDEQVQLLQGQLKQITQMRETKDFDEFMGDKIYLKLNGIDTEQDRQAAEEWRASHPGTRMDYNYANSWTNSAISPDRIDVVSLQSKDGKDVRTSQKDLIKYFLSQTSIDKIEELGVNDTTLENIRKYYQEHSAEIAQMGEEYSVVTQNIQEFEQSRESKEAEKKSETRETEITAPEIEKHEENLPAKQDNSFLGKIKRVFANMKDMKNKDNSKGFFARLGASIQTVFGNKKDEFDKKQDENITLNSTQRKEQTREDSKQTNYLTQHFEVNEKQAVQDLKKKQDSKDKDSQLSQDDQEFGNL